MAAEVTVYTPYTAYAGNPLRVVPIRNTATEGPAEDISWKEGLRHICIKVHLTVGSGDYYTYGRPVRSACFHNFTAGKMGDVVWDPDDATGKITISVDDVGEAYGWLHIWSYD